MRAGIAQLSDWAVGADIRRAVIPSVTVGRDEDDLALSWLHEDADSDGYLVWYHAVDPYFMPGAGGAVSVDVLPPGGYTHDGVIGDGQCYFYLVQGRNGAGIPSGVSARTGKFDFSLAPGQ